MFLFVLFCSVWFGKKNFNWLVLFCSGRTLKHRCDRSLLHRTLHTCKLMTGSDKIMYWLDRYSFLLGFIMSKNSKCFWIYILIKSSVRNFSQFYFWLHKTQKERVSTESINYLIRLVFRTNSGKLHLKVVCSSSVMICSVLLTYSGCRNELELHFKVTRYVV